jgi:hypothetical protein
MFPVPFPLLEHRRDLAVIWRIVSRVVLFAFCGMIVMAIVGGCEGAVTGGILGMLAMGYPAGSAEGATLGMIIGGANAGIIGAISGALSFAIVGGVTSRRNDQDFLLNNAMLWSARGSAVGVYWVGSAEWEPQQCLGIALSRNLQVPLEIISLMVICSVSLVDSSLVTFAGVFYGTLAKKFQPESRVPCDVSTFEASP